jgi:type IV secretory pathway VirD2 relaxase
MAERFAGRPLFDVASYASRGSSRRDRLTPAEVDQIRRTVARTPEVLVKVLTRGATTTAQVKAHAEYIGREGTLEVETDDGRRLTGEDVGDHLVEDWNLDLPADDSAERVARGGGREARLVHKLIFSMPPGTPADKVLGAVRDFAREEFGLQHRYAFALHTDEPHPHVHVIVKAISEQGVRLNIGKDTLRAWRSRFAEQLRARGVAANATERAARGQSRKALKDSIYRADERGASTHVHERLLAAHRTVASGARSSREPGSARLRETNEQIVAGYRALASMLVDQDERNLGAYVRMFAERIQYPPAQQEHERMRVRDMERPRDTKRRERFTR